MLRVITTFYNVEDYIERCIGSLMGQNYNDFICYLIDDVSTDSSVEKIKHMIKDDNRFKLIINTKKKYKTLNYIDVLNYDSEINDDDIVIELDGDDWLPNSNVLKRIKNVYDDQKVWITNGSFMYSSGQKGFSSEQIDFQNLRINRFTASHLRTWKVFLWRAINEVDHKDLNGNYWKVNADLAYMLPMLEMAGNEHYKFLSDINLIYNEINPLNDHKVDMKLVDDLAKEIRSRKKYNLLNR
jgi:glycosyltransferase involved in cell wall biosynthesis